MHTFLHFVVSLQNRFYTLGLIFVFDVNIYSYIKGLVSHQEFAGSNSCWRPFFGTNRLDDLESFYNPSYI
jgi:hypothetical protein